MKNHKFYLGLDQGSGSSKAILLDSFGREVFTDTITVSTQHFDDGRVEQDASELFLSIYSLFQNSIAHAKTLGGEIKTVGLSLQRSGVLAWDKEGNPQSSVLTWRDSRFKDEISKLSDHSDYIYHTTGLPLTYHYAAYKIGALQKEFPMSYVGTLDSFFAYKLSGLKNFVSEESHASRSQLYSLEKRRWDPKLLEIFGVDIKRSPEIKPSFGDFGSLERIPVKVILGDQQAAFFGLNSPGAVVLIIGTFGTVIVPKNNLGSLKGYLTGVSYSKGSEISYQLEASINAPGQTIEFLKGTNDPINGIAEINKILKGYAPIESSTIAFFPFQSSGSPHWKTDLKNIFNKEPKDKLELVSSLVENIGNWIGCNFEKLIEADVVKGTNKLILAGGGSEIEYLVRYLKSLLGIEIYKADNHHGSAYGAAYAALCADKPEFKNGEIGKEKISSNLDTSVIKKRYESWKELYSKSLRKNL